MASKEAAIDAGVEAGFSRDEALRRIKSIGMGWKDAIAYFAGIDRLELARRENTAVLAAAKILRDGTPNPEDNEPQTLYPSTILGVRSGSGPIRSKSGKRARSQRFRQVESIVIRREDKK